jgi:UDP-N-acetylmuramoyl-L-alanyl-D-glutamate--2,6-diaminopimelate ligase
MRVKKLIKKLIPKELFKKIEPTGHKLEAMILHALNGFPAKKFKIIGVTGTNGKTSTVYLIHKMLHEAGFKVGFMSTVAYGVGDNVNAQVHHMTNVSVRELIKRLKWMRSQEAEWIVVESTSHGLAQHRLWGLPFSIAVMTNITHEHLDYHGTFEAYRAAKLTLFELTNKNKKGLQTGVVNAEDPAVGLFSNAVKNPITYGQKEGDLKTSMIRLSPSGSQFAAEMEDDEYLINCHLPGSFNVSNALAAVAVGRKLGLTRKQIEQGISALDGVEGRMTRISEGQDFDLIVDFAHTPDSFEKLFKDLKPVVEGRLIVMFGSAGRRDEAKRAVQGKLAGEYADIVVLTEEDDRDINGKEIMNEIASGAVHAGKRKDENLFMVGDRTEAINYTVGLAKAGDTVLLLGKGHEKTIERKDGEHPWDEIATAHQAVKDLSD